MQREAKNMVITKDTTVDDAMDFLFAELGAQDYIRQLEAKCKSEGREEGKSEIVRNLLASGMPVDEVARIAAWSAEKVRELSREQ